MRIAIDIRPLMEVQRTGVARYALHLLHEVLAQNAALPEGTHDDYVLYANARGARLPDDFRPYPIGVSAQFTRVPNRLLNASTFLFRRPRIERGIPGGVDAVYLPNLNFIATDRPLIVTVHDLSFLRHPEYFSAKQRAWHAMVQPERLIRRATTIVAVSEHTKSDVMELVGVAAERIRVIPPGVSLGRIPTSHEEALAVLARFSVRRPFFLYVGAMEPRKNLVALVEAFSAIPGNVELIIAGSDGWRNRTVHEAIRRSPARDRIRLLGYVTDDEKTALYVAAIALVYPALYEGFGMPPAEAMMCGTPVIAGASSSLGEVVGNAGLLVNPHDVADIAEAMRAMLDDSDLRMELSRRGRAHATRFDWAASATALRKTFAELK